MKSYWKSNENLDFPINHQHFQSLVDVLCCISATGSSYIKFLKKRDSKVPAIELAQPHALEWTHKKKSPGVMAHPQLFWPDVLFSLLYGHPAKYPLSGPERRNPFNPTIMIPRNFSWHVARFAVPELDQRNTSNNVIAKPPTVEFKIIPWHVKIIK